MGNLAVVAAVGLLVIVAVASARVVLRVLLPNRREVLRLQNERIERMLREEPEERLEAMETVAAA